MLGKDNFRTSQKVCKIYQQLSKAQFFWDFELILCRYYLKEETWFSIKQQMIKVSNKTIKIGVLKDDQKVIANTLKPFGEGNYDPYYSYAFLGFYIYSIGMEVLRMDIDLLVLVACLLSCKQLILYPLIKFGPRPQWWAWHMLTKGN